jgi:hypothetical protein
VEIQRADVFKQGDEPGMQIEVSSSLVGWDDHTFYDKQIRNYTKKPIEVEIRRVFPVDVVFRSSLSARNHDHQTVQYIASAKPGQRADFLYEVLQHQGRNAKHDNVAVEKVPMRQ